MFFNDYSKGSIFNKDGTLKDLDAKTRKKLSHILTFHPLKSQTKMLSLHKYFKNQNNQQNYLLSLFENL